VVVVVGGWCYELGGGGGGGGGGGCNVGWWGVWGGWGAVGEDEMSVDVLFCEGGVSGMELWLVVGGCESIERG